MDRLHVALTAGAGHDVGERRNALTLVQGGTRSSRDVIAITHDRAEILLPSLWLSRPRRLRFIGSDG